MNLKKKLNLEMLRIIACFFVIVNHTIDQVFLSKTPSITWFISLIYFFMSKIAVPLFVMISGAVLLGKQETYKELFKKRILRIILVIIIFSFINSLVFNGKLPADIISFLKHIYIQPTPLAYWYLYMYLGLLVMLPIIRKMVSNFENKDYIYFSIIWAIAIGIMPILNKYYNIEYPTYFFEIPIFSGYIIYFILGYFIENKLEEKYINKKIAIILSIFSIICIALSVILTYYEYIYNNNSYLFMDNIKFITVAVPTIGVFYLCKYKILNKNSNIFEKTVTIIGSCTFGIYLLSEIFVQKLKPIYIYLIEYINPIISIIIIEISIFILGFIITLILKKIPLIKKLI